MVKRMSAREARNNFSDLLGLVYYSKEAVVVEKRGRPFAVVISPEDYEKLLRERERDFAIFDEIHAKNLDVAPEEVEEAVAREVAALRKKKGSEVEKN